MIEEQWRPIGPLLACPAGADVFQLTPPIQNIASPVGLPNRKESFAYPGERRKALRGLSRI